MNKRLIRKRSSILYTPKKGVIIPIILLLLMTISGCGGGGGGGSTGTSGTQNNSSSNSLNGTITLSWDAPSTNEDGTASTDLAGYRVYYGASSNSYTESVNIGNTTSAVISGLTAGTWCMAVTAYDKWGNESYYSEEVCKTI